MRPHLVVFLLLTLAACCRLWAGEPIVFEKHVRPILKAHCFQCHGEGGARKGELDLRLRRLIVKGGESGAAIEPGNPAASFLLDRIGDGEMPPGEKRLNREEIGLIKDWIAGGAHTARDEPEAIGDEPILTQEERDFWSFQPIRRPPLPAVNNFDRVRTPVDVFVLARLEREGLALSADADRRTLVRRAFFDLIGLPPSPEEMQAFLNDQSRDAYERLIDRLLASPHYGERWGRHWLDVAGYADSEGYTDEDKVRPSAFRYRDYVVRCFNTDKPFGQFIQEQLAGDELAGDKTAGDKTAGDKMAGDKTGPPPHGNLSPAQIEKLTATGFLRMAPDGTASGGIDQNIARNEVVADTIKIVSTSLLGLTVGCARCHDHRYDPLSQADYYRMRAIFEPALDWKQWKPPPARLVSLYTDADRATAKQIEAEAAKVDQQRKQKTQQYIDRTLEEELATLPQAEQEPLRAAYKTAAGKRTAAQKQLLKEHPSVANISAGSLYLYDRRREERARKFDADRIAKEKRLIDQTRQNELEKVPAEARDAVRFAWQTASGKRTADQRALLKEHPGVAVTALTLARFNPAAASQLQRDKLAAKKSRSEKAADDLKQYTARAAAIRAKIPKENFVRALTEPTGHTPPTFVFHRGDHEQPKQQVGPAEFTVLRLGLGGRPESRPSSIAETDSRLSTETQRFTIPENDPQLSTTGRRLTYARHLTSGEHPLVARVIVNRIWLHHFGRGLVNSPGDFGFLGQRPTHPDLLDWLADEFMKPKRASLPDNENGAWSIKRLHKLMMLSTAYRQSSRRTERLDRMDPDNRLYARMSIRRLESEAIRDSVLAVSGLMNRKLYGPPVPVMEDEVGQIVLGKENLDGERKPTSRIALGGEEFRRSLYVQVRRSRPLAVLDTFDTPAMTPNCPQRNSSNVAPQSLLLMNSGFAVEHAEHFARRVAAEAGDDVRAQIARAWQLAFGCEPNAGDLDTAHAFVRKQAEVFGRSAEQKQASTADRQAMATLCQALLSANRFIYID